MKLNNGDYLYCSKGSDKNIKCGDGVVGQFNPKLGEMYQIIEINDKELCINFKGHSVWFLLEEDNNDYFCEWYKKYFDDIKIKRKKKLDEIKRNR